MTAATIRAAGHTVRGTYHGGPYIDLHLDGDREAFDCVNVWDYAADRPTIRIEWRDAAGDSLAHDLREYALAMRAYR